MLYGPTVVQSFFQRMRWFRDCHCHCTHWGDLVKQRLSGTPKVPKEDSEKPNHGSQGVCGYLASLLAGLASLPMVIRKYQTPEKINTLLMLMQSF